MVSLSYGSLRPKHEELKQALMGQLRGRLRFVVGQELAQIRSIDEQIVACDEEVGKVMDPFQDEINRLDEIPGIGRRNAENIIAEIGVDLRRWPTVRHFTSWCGVCPGNKASGGKRRPARTRKGNPWVKRAGTEAAWAAGRAKASYLGERFRRLAAHKGQKRAIVAVAHEILQIIYFILTRGGRYQDLGVNYIEDRHRAAIERQALRQLTRLGYDVHLTPQGQAA